jgi:GT2 family glycosyltransferase
VKPESAVTPMTPPTVAVILVTFYGTTNLERLWASLRTQRYPSSCWRLTVIDNSPDGTATRWFRDNGAEAHVLFPGHNTGYAGGNALGMQDALSAGDDYALVVTQDVCLEPDALRALVDVAETHPGAGAVQPKLLRRTPEGRVVIHSRGNELHYVGVGFVGGDGEADRPLEVHPIAYASGAAALYRTRALREVGVFDPGLFMYHEDSDLGWRMHLAGWDTLLAPEAIVHHDYDFARPAWRMKWYYVERNRWINLLTHYRAATLLLLAPALLGFELVSLLYAARRGWLGERLAAYLFFVRAETWRYLKVKRRAVQAVRRRRDSDLACMLSARFAFGPVATPLVRWILDPAFAAYWGMVRRVLAW